MNARKALLLFPSTSPDKYPLLFFNAILIHSPCLLLLYYVYRRPITAHYFLYGYVQPLTADPNYVLCSAVLYCTVLYVRYTTFRDNKDASITEIHDFVKKIPKLTLEYKSLNQHINIAEMLKQRTDRYHMCTGGICVICSVFKFIVEGYHVGGQCLFFLFLIRPRSSFFGVGTPFPPFHVFMH